MRKNFFLSVIILCVQISAAQDTLTFMHYNLLNYGNTAPFCPESVYPLSSKNKYIQTIINHVNPDIVTFNEVSPESHFHDSLLAALQANRTSSYVLAPATNLAKSNIISLLFYNSEKVALHSAKVIRHPLRDINVYRLYYKDKEENSADTVFFTCIAAHLKAGSTAGDAEIRASMAQEIMQWLSERGGYQNYFLMGDFNLYSSKEAAYQLFTAVDYTYTQFFDPLDSEGDWHKNQRYTAIHTQSTHLASEGCFASGGLDDRFDFILFNKAVKEEKLGIHYIEGSYQVLGNDGSFFNDSVYYSENASAPEEIMRALYHNSDHLPVMLKIYADPNNVVSIKKYEKRSRPNFQVKLKSPVTNELKLWIQSKSGEQFNLQVTEIKGNVILSKDLSFIEGEKEFNIPVRFSKGVYILSITDSKGNRQTIKLVKI